MEQNEIADCEYTPPEDTKLFPCGRISSTEIAHVYKLDDGFYREPWSDVIDFGEYGIFDECDQFLKAYNTLGEAEAAIIAYCHSLNGQSA